MLQVGRIVKMNVCCDFEKWPIISMLSVVISLTFGLTMLVAYGANSLEELRNQVENPVIDTYRKELINYLIEHNIAKTYEDKQGHKFALLYDTNTINFNDTELELVVQDDMMKCNDSIENESIPFDPRCAPVSKAIADFMNNK